MGDPYWRYGASADRAFPGYIPSDASTLSSQPVWPPHNLLSSSSDILQKDILASRSGAYGVDDITGIGVRPESGFPSAWEDPYVPGRRDVIHDTGPGIPDIANGSLRMADGLPLGPRESNVLFVDGLPSDCTRREVSHLFRPFLGFKEIRLVHKEPKHSADKAMVLCFVEFSDSNHALTALEALQGYKFDNKKPDSLALQIHFAHFPFQLPRAREEQGLVIPREREPSVQDAKPVMMVKRKLEGSPGFFKKGKVEASQNKYDHREEQKRCAKCNKKQHLGDCSTKSRTCYNCGKTDHLSRDCTIKDQKCYSCGKTNHLSRDCTLKNRKCYGCGELGHIIAECPNVSGLEKGGNASEVLEKKEDPPKT